MADALKADGREFFHAPKANIITLKRDSIAKTIAEKYFLVPDDHNAPNWWKIVAMDHVKDAVLEAFLRDLT